MDRGASQAIVHGVAKSQTQLRDCAHTVTTVKTNRNTGCISSDFFFLDYRISQVHLVKFGKYGRTQ